jgi:hypothetical protein
MQHLQPHRASTIAAVTAAAMLAFTGLASAQAQSAGRVVNEGTEVQVTSAPIRTSQRYRAAQWLLDMLPDKAPNRDDELIGACGALGARSRPNDRPLGRQVSRPARSDH